MSMSKRFQIPASPQDQRLFKSAARRSGLSAAEWARRLLRREAENQLREKSWDHLFELLHQEGDLSDWEIPERKPARPSLKKEDDWG